MSDEKREAAVTSGKQLLDHLRWFDTCQPLVQALIFHAEPLVVEAEQVQDGRVEIADVDWILDNVVYEVLGLAVDGAGPRAAARHAHREATRMVVAAVIRLAQPTLRVNGPAKLAAPDHQRRV